MQHLNLSLRESEQTAIAVSDLSDLANAQTPGPSQIDFFAVRKFIHDVLPTHPYLHIELPNPTSSPQRSREIKQIFHSAPTSVKDRLAVHVRAKTEDFLTALNSGARVIYGFRDPSRSVHGEQGLVSTITDFSNLADLVNSYQATMRASMERATAPENRDTVVPFALSILGINKLFNKSPINMIGYPDTNGQFTTDSCSRLLNQVIPILTEENIIYSVHLHNDLNHAPEAYDIIQDICQRYGVSTLVDVASKLRPGERTGIWPSIEDFPDLIPASASELVSGNSWVLLGQNEQDVKRTHTAGVHNQTELTRINYSLAKKVTQYPCPGGYAIAGTGNITCAADLQNIHLSDKTIANTALVLRELTAVNGVQNQGYVLRLVEFSAENSQLINTIVESFGPSADWPNSEPIDLSGLHEQLLDAKLSS